MKRIIVTFLFGLLAFTGFSQDPYPREQRISDPLKTAKIAGPVSVEGPVIFKPMDTSHVAATLAKYKNSIQQGLDGNLYIATGTHWEKLVREVPVTWPLYFDSEGILNVAPGSPNSLISVDTIFIDDHDITIGDPIIYTYNSQLETINTPAVFTISDAATDSYRTDIIAIDSNGVLQYYTGVEDTMITVPPMIPYNAIPITTINIFEDQFIIGSIDPSFAWATAGNTPLNSSVVFGTKNTVPVRHIWNNVEMMYLSSIGLTINKNEAGATNDKNSYNMRFLAGNSNEQVGTIGMDGFIAGPTWGSFKLTSTGDMGLLGNAAGQLSTNYRNIIYQNSNGPLHLVTGSGVHTFTNSSQGATGILLQGNRTNTSNIQAPVFQFGLRGTFLMQKDSIDGVITPSAMMDLRHDAKGILIPRMSTSDRDNISSPATSLLIFNNTTNQYEWYNGTAWTALGGGGTSGWGFAGNAITTGDFLGTTNTEDLVLKANNVQLGLFSGDGNYRVGLGFGALPLGNYSIAIGLNSFASGTQATALGLGTSASGDGSISLGATANGNISIAIGNGSISDGANSNTLGANNHAIGNSSSSIGTESFSIGSYSMAVGFAVKTKATGAVAIGMYNDTTDTPLGNGTDRLFQLGNGSQLGGNSNAITALRNGHIGIGSANLTPAAALHIKAITSELTPVIIDDLGTYANDTAAGGAGLTTGMLYKTAAGVLMIKL